MKTKNGIIKCFNQAVQFFEKKINPIGAGVIISSIIIVGANMVGVANDSFSPVLSNLNIICISMNIAYSCALFSQLIKFKTKSTNETPLGEFNQS